MNIKQFLLFLFLPSVTLGQENTYTIKGTVKNYFPGQKIYFIPLGVKERVLDSATIENGTFTFTGSIDKSTPPEELYWRTGNLFLAHTNKGLNMNLVVIDGKQEVKDTKTVHLLPGLTIVNVIDSLRYSKIQSSTENQAYYALDSIYQSPYQNQNKLVSELLKQKDLPLQVLAKTLDSLSTVFQQEADKKKWQFVKEHPRSPASLNILKYDFDHNQKPEHAKLAPYYYGLSSRLRETKFGKEYGLMLNQLKNIKIGATAPDFTLKDVNSRPVSLSTLRGKYVLINFWAPGPIESRVQNTNVVVPAYDEFKEQNFTVLGVSLCENQKDWLAYIRIDKLPWIELSDLKGLDSPVAKLYAVKAVSQNFLIDPSGKIIAKNLFGKDLNKQLTEIFKK